MKILKNKYSFDNDKGFFNKSDQEKIFLEYLADHLILVKIYIKIDKIQNAR